MKRIICYIVLMMFNLNVLAQKKTIKDTLIIEIRTYTIKPDKRDDFHALVVKTLPLLKKYGIEVVRYGPSLHDSTSYVLIRSFRNLEEREKLEDAFYGSDDWKLGSRDAVLALIETYTTMVMPVHKKVADYLKTNTQ
jgi:hypothetical protein